MQPLSVLQARLGSKSTLPTTRIFYRLGRTILKGLKQFRISGPMFQQYYHNAKLRTLDAEQMGPDFIREIGTYYAEPKIPGGANLSGKYVFIWKKSGQ